MTKAVNDALEREGDKKLCPSCQEVNSIENKECKDCGLKFSRRSTPEDGF